MKKIPLGIQTFKEIVDGNYVYVDKTQHIYDLINGAKYCFLSRPRRFGKSLLLDTIGQVFSGSRELFKGLWIYDSDYIFEKHPVIRLDMSNIPNETPGILKDSIGEELIVLAGKHGIAMTHGEPAVLFKRFIENLHKKYNQKVVVLVDEYDKPILDHINDAETAESNRMVIRGFYGILKSMDPYLRFTFITGVTKFTKTSIFSDLNNLLDITMAEDYANICGIPIESLEYYFGEHIKSLAESENFKLYDNLRDAILAWYDGYSWDGKTKLLNPFSLLSFFSQRRLESFWYASGTPNFLIDLIKKKPESFATLKNFEIRERVLDTFNIRVMETEPLLFQTGYLTVKEVIRSIGPTVYVLDMPNLEVSEAFSLQVIAELTEKGDVFTESSYMKLREALRIGNLNIMLDILRGLFASIPYERHVAAETYYHSILYAVMKVLGFDIDAEVSVSGGRVDAVFELGDKVYIVEFKYKNCPPDTSDDDKHKLFAAALEDGMVQIKDRGYCNKYAGSGKTIYQAAFAFLGRDEIEMVMEILKEV